MEVEVLQWFVGPGDRVSQFDKLCEVQSDKVCLCVRACVFVWVSLYCGESLTRVNIYPFVCVCGGVSTRDDVPTAPCFVWVAGWLVGEVTLAGTFDQPRLQHHLFSFLVPAVAHWRSQLCTT